MPLIQKILNQKYLSSLAIATVIITLAPVAIAQQPSNQNSSNQQPSNQQPGKKKPSNQNLSNQQSAAKKPSPQQSAKKTDSDYINQLLPQARRIQKEYGVPLDITLAIARQESGNGDYVIGKGNHFGLRCDSDDCITLEKNGQMISYETCPQVSECFNIFAESINALAGDKPITLQRLYQNGYATSTTWVERVGVIRKEVQQTLSEAGIKY